MEKAVRDLFKSERIRLGLNQTQVAEKSGGVTQGMISQIEIDSDYEPSVAVFKKALRGIGQSLASFFGRIEGAAPLSPAPVDDGLPPIVPVDQVTERVIQTLAELLAHASQRADEAHHRQAAGPRHSPARRPPAPRKRARRPPPRRKRSRRVGR